MDEAPAGFAPLFRTSPFLDAVGPFYGREDGEGGLVLGVRVAEKHTNARGTAHGGLLVTMADVALGYNASYVGVEKRADVAPTALLTTANLSVDFAGSARLGDWIETRVDVQRVGRRLAFANAYLFAGEKRITRASAVFAAAPNEEAAGGRAADSSSGR